MWRINSVEEITTTTTEAYSDEEEYSDLPSLGLDLTPIKVPFPEAGIDLIDVNTNGLQINEELQKECPNKWYDLQNWEENWLFKKKKRKDSKSDILLGYMAMVLAELPVAMLIPNPIDKIRASVGDREVDELSELSEHNSYGSLEFSDDESEYESDSQNNEINGSEELIKQTNNESIATERVPSIKKTTNDANNDSFGPKVIKTVGNNNDNKNKPNVKTIICGTKTPNYLPKELRNNQTNGESDPHLVLIPGDACVQSGIVVQFCCRAKGTKPLSFSWFKSDTILKSDQNFRIFQSGEENVLEIKKTCADDSAQYSCVVYNSFGYHWCDFNLKVYETNFLNNNNMPLNKRNFNKRDNSSNKSKGVSNNPKHEKHKTRPLVVQRTWAERVAELHNNIRAQSLISETNEENIEEKSDKENEGEDWPDNSPVQTTPITGTIAEREHKKWETSDVDWKDNPYSTENLNSRIQRRANLLDVTEETEPLSVIEEKEDKDTDNSFLSSKSKDMSRYKKDYYIKQSAQTSTKDETLRSFDETEYSNPKYFDFNHSMRQLSEEVSQTSENSSERNSNEMESDLNLSDSDILLPSVKELVNKFASNSDLSEKTPNLLDIKRKNSLSDTKINNMPKNMFQTTQSNFKVHSLTARSLSKEFREMSQLNLPRSQHNRMGINGQKQVIGSLIESESSDPSTACSPTNEGYASDESNSSSITSGGPPVPPPVLSNKSHEKSNNERKFSRSILRRASYWEKRCEQGLISDSSVNEDFPPMEKFAN